MISGSSKTIHSKDQAGGSREDLIRHALGELSKSSAWSWVTFESEGSSDPIESAVDGDHFTLNIPHKEKDGLIPKLGSLGLAVPAGWVIKKDKKKSFLSGGFLEIEVGFLEIEKIPVFITEVGRQAFGWDDTRNLSASFQT